MFSTHTGICQYKKKKKNSLLRRFYHNTTSRYNGYFYAKLKLNTAINNLKEAHADNYDEILPLFPYIDADKKQSISPNMDEIIKKTSLVINRHPLTKWVDNCYLLLGQAYYLKTDYENALQTFSYISSEYKSGFKKTKSKKRKKKKKGEDKDNFFTNLKHQPVYYDAVLWLIHTYIEDNEFEKAQTVIDLMKSDEKFPEKLKGALEIMQAHLYLKDGKNENAIKPLSNGIKLTKKKKNKIRYTFILAQLYHETQNNKKALEKYTEVLKMNPSYEIEFNAKINIAKAYEIDEHLSIENVKDQLLDLVKDDKNIEYLDQIYYLLADLSLKENNTEEAIRYLALSIENNTTNKNQKALSFMTMADIHFKNQNYPSAKSYYDSTLVFLPQNNDNYSFIKNKNNILADLVKNIQVIEEQDNLQYLASLSPKERDAAIDEIIKKKRDELEKQSVKNITKLQNNTKKNIKQIGDWYFYNINARSIGYNDFITKWGNRPLEDNWRRKDKSFMSSENEQNNNENNIQEKQENNSFNRDAYYKKIPLTPELIDISNNKVIEALYKKAIIFKEKLHDYLNSISTFEKLNSRYPNNKYQLESCYYLYLLNNQINDQNKCKHYKNLILSKYPNSNFAKNILDPGYAEENKLNAKKVSSFYESTYALYLNADYNTVIYNSFLADSLYPNNHLIPKFMFLKALSYSKTNNYNLLKETLENIIKN